MQVRNGSVPDSHRRADEFAKRIAHGNPPPSRSVEEVVADMRSRLNGEQGDS